MKTKFVIFFLLSWVCQTHGQITFLQDIIHGGVTSSSYLAGPNSATPGLIDLDIPSGSTLKKVYIIIPNWNFAPTYQHEIDGVIINTDGNLTHTYSNSLNVNATSSNDVHTINLQVYDISSYITNTANSVLIQPQFFQNGFNNGVEFEFTIIVVFENPIFTKMSFTFFLNEKSAASQLNYFCENINTLDTTKSIGISLNSDVLCNDSIDGYIVKIENDIIGTIGGEDYNTTTNCSGSTGSFSYYNDSLRSLGDDTANTTMNGVDAIANISKYVNSLNDLNIQLNYGNPNPTDPIDPFTNILLHFSLTHSTLCDTFTTLVKDNIQVCKTDSIQMQVTSAPLSNHTFEWEPQEGLSCYNCAQPYFTDTVSRWYTVRIWNNDSCSKVLPVRVEVLEKPLNPIVTVSPTKCSDSSGVANVQLVESSYQYSINNSMAQTGNIFNNLHAGVHNINAIDTNGCKSSTSINITETYPNAVFTATPLQGDVPLDVSFYNTSTGANNFIWHIEQDTLFSTNTTHIFNSEGYFDATLVAYDTYPWCSDTASVRIFAEYPFTIFAPTLQDDKKGNYQIYTSGVKSLNYHLYNALGQIIYTKELDTSQGYQDLWSAYTVAKGTYVFKIVAVGENGEVKVVSGKVAVI